MKKTYIITGGAAIIHGVGDVRVEYKPGAEIELMDEEAARLGISVELKIGAGKAGIEANEPSGTPPEETEGKTKGFLKSFSKGKK